MNSNCALRNLYSDSLLKKVEINLGGNDELYLFP